MFVVTLPSTATNDPQAFASKAKAAGADLLEIRGDITPLVSTFDSPLPIIISPRGTGDALLRVLQPAYVDLELKEDVPVPSETLVIRSFHDHTRTPKENELRSIVTQLLRYNPDVVKVATTVTHYADLERLSVIRDLLPKDRRVVIGMGKRAHSSRMLSPLQNTFTYTYLDGQEPSVAGQLPLSVYRMISHCKEPHIFGILGGLEVQSSSPLIHNTLFQAHDIDAIFSSFLTEDLEDAFAYIKRKHVSGLSVTTPFKGKIIDLLDEIDPIAEELQSVNTVLFENGRYKGYNTDIEGLQKGYECIRGASTVAVIGSGGVVPSIVHACEKQGARNITIFARNERERGKLKMLLH